MSSGQKDSTAIHQADHYQDGCDVANGGFARGDNQVVIDDARSRHATARAYRTTSI
jgi:hypothetical protein